MNADKKLLAECKKRVEEKLKWGASETWKQRDYENLIQLIYEETGTLLSLTTIKRIWKKDFDKTPHPSTLNALAKYLGFKDWLEFKNSSMGIVTEVEGKREKSNVTVKIFAVGSMLLLIYFIVRILVTGDDYADFDQVKLSSRKVVSNGVPNTVIFDYDLKKVTEDSVFFQQSWNQYERMFVSPENNQLTAIYYFPGYHEAKLIIKEQVVVTIPVHITTSDWLMAVRYDPYDIQPAYVAVNGLTTSGNLHVTPEYLKANTIDIEERAYWVSFFNVRDFGEVFGDNFKLETEFRNSKDEGGLLCRYLYLLIYCEKSAIVIPFGDAGCAGNFNFMLYDKTMSGKNKDMSNFGSNMDDWNQLLVSVKEKQCVIKLNEREIVVDSFTIDPGKIVGIQFLFYGTGSVNNVTIKDKDGRSVYADDFE